MPASHHLLRRAAALLASVALLSATARPVLACQMGQADSSGQTSATGAHAHHGVAPADDAPAPDARNVVACDHLVGCAVMVVAPSAPVALTPIVAAAREPHAYVVRVEAPARTVEPPPPRR